MYVEYQLIEDTLEESHFHLKDHRYRPYPVPLLQCRLGSTTD